VTDFEVIAHVKDEAVARVLLAAMRAHGFHPKDLSDGGLPGLARAVMPKGIAIEVPVDEARDAKPLAEAILADMTRT
jgi:hypothetical protein